MVAADPFETLVSIYQIARHHIPENSNLLREEMCITVSIEVNLTGRTSFVNTLLA
jgi:hypothetical protein